LRERLLERIILQDRPHTPRERFALGVHRAGDGNVCRRRFWQKTVA
jgi:hypothetical protein